MRKQIILCDVCHSENNHCTTQTIPTISYNSKVSFREVDICPCCLTKITKVRCDVDIDQTERFSIVSPELDALLEMAHEESAKAENGALHANNNMTGRYAIGRMDMADAFVKKIISLKGESE